jgi:hypothetical protein
MFGSGIWEKNSLYYEYGPSSDIGTATPFPLLYGRCLNPAITRIIVQNATNVSYEAKIVNAKTGGSMWFVRLPVEADTVYTVEGLDAKGNVLETHTKELDPFKQPASATTVGTPQN